MLNRIAVQRVMQANLLKFMSEVFSGTQQKYLKAAQKYIMGDEFWVDILECSSNLSWNYKATSTAEFIAPGKYHAGDWYNPPEWEEVYLDAPDSFDVKLSGHIDLYCIEKNLQKNTLLELGSVDYKKFAKLLIDVILAGARNAPADFMEHFEELSYELEDEWKSEAGDIDSVIFNAYLVKMKKGQAKSSGKFTLEFKVEVEAEDIELRPYEPDPDDYR